MAWDPTGLADSLGCLLKKVSENEVGWCLNWSEMWALLLEDELGTARSLSHYGTVVFHSSHRLTLDWGKIWAADRTGALWFSVIFNDESSSPLFLTLDPFYFQVNIWD